MLVKIEAQILIFPGTDFHFPSTFVPPGTFFKALLVTLFTRRLPYVQCSKNRLTCENYTAVYKLFQEHQVNSRRFPVFQGAISNSRRCPGVVYTQFYTLNGIPVTRSMHLSHNGNLKYRLHLSNITLWTLLTLPAGVC